MFSFQRREIITCQTSIVSIVDDLIRFVFYYISLYMEVAIFCSVNFIQNAWMAAMAWIVQEHVATVRTMASVTSRMAPVPPAVNRGTTEGSVCWSVVTVRQGHSVRM